MLKKEAAQYLGVSERAISRYVVKGKLTVSYRRKEAGGSEALFDPLQVEALKQEMESPPPKKKPQKKTEPESQALTRRDRGGEMQTILSGLTEALTASPRAVPIESKLLLTLDQAAALSGLSRDYLRQGIRDGRLVARIIGRGFKIKREALEVFIDGL